MPAEAAGPAVIDKQGSQRSHSLPGHSWVPGAAGCLAQQPSRHGRLRSTPQHQQLSDVLARMSQTTAAGNACQSWVALWWCLQVGVLLLHAELLLLLLLLLQQWLGLLVVLPLLLPFLGVLTIQLNQGHNRTAVLLP